MADISLTASMRSNLLSLQSTQSLMDMTQERLSTGKKVNSAIDNPSSYYTAQSLNNRADDLSALLDSMGQGVQTIKAANEAIETITSFAEQAKAIANSARDVASNYDKYAITSEEISEGVDATIIIDARKDLSEFSIDFTAGAAAGNKFTVYDSEGKGTEIALTGGNAGEIASNALTSIQGLGLNASLKGNVLTVSSTDGSDISWVNGDKASGNKMTGAAATGSAIEVTLTATDKGKNSATIAAALNDTTTGPGALVSASADGKRVSIQAASSANEFRIFAKDGAKAEELDELGLTGSKKAGDPSEVTQERVDYAKQFNEILSQIDDLAKDASYKGINLLQENDLTVIFNEDRSSKLEVKGVDASSEGLGMSAAQNDWQKDSNIDTAISQIEGAISKLRTMASDFGNNYSIVQTREDFKFD